MKTKFLKKLKVEMQNKIYKLKDESSYILKDLIILMVIIYIITNSLYVFLLEPLFKIEFKTYSLIVIIISVSYIFSSYKSRKSLFHKEYLIDTDNKVLMIIKLNSKLIEIKLEDYMLNVVDIDSGVSYILFNKNTNRNEISLNEHIAEFDEFIMKLKENIELHPSSLII